MFAAILKNPFFLYYVHMSFFCPVLVLLTGVVWWVWMIKHPGMKIVGVIFNRTTGFFCELQGGLQQQKRYHELATNLGHKRKKNQWPQ